MGECVETHTEARRGCAGALAALACLLVGLSLWWWGLDGTLTVVGEVLVVLGVVRLTGGR